jgi:hypothetical protein
VAVLVSLAVLSGALPGLSRACGAGHGWALTAAAAPSSFAPADGSGQDELRLEAVDIGGSAPEGAVTIADKLPAGLTAVDVEGEGAERCTLGSLTCVFSGGTLRGRRVAVVIHVDVDADVPTSVVNEASVLGGGAPEASTSDRIQITSLPVAFGVERYALTANTEDGAPDTQAGSHPYELTAEVGLNQTLNRKVRSRRRARSRTCISNFLRD